MFSFTEKTITDALLRIVTEMTEGAEKAVDLVKSPSIYSFDNLIRARSCEFEMDLARVGLTSKRWRRFLTQYVIEDDLRKWLDGIGEQRRGIVNFFRSYGETGVAPDHYHPEMTGHRWGPCFLGIGFTFSPKPKMTLYSRTARVPTTACMELNLCSLLAKEIKERYNLQQTISFSWFVSAIHITAFDILPWLVYHNQIEEFIKVETGLNRFVGRQFREIAGLEEITRDNIPYGRKRRVARRISEMLKGKYLPECQMSGLVIWKEGK